MRPHRFAGVFAMVFLACATPLLRGQTTRDSTVCATCHLKIVQTYGRTGMARSFFRPAAESDVEDYTDKNTFDHQPSGIHFEMRHPAGGTYIQRQYTIGFDGKKTNILDTKIDYVLGSGNHARTYLSRTPKGTLVELPLGWYGEKGGYWAMNPGYDRPDHQGLQRAIGYDCMFCHNAYPEIPARSGPRSPPVFLKLPEGIDCQRCHGDGARHVSIARGKGARLEDIRHAIVNPARLTKERQMEVCLQCHLETTSSPLPASIVRYERGPFSYRPGEPLSDFILHFDRLLNTGQEDRFEITGSAYRLRQSQCFLKSQGALTCTTCHNPHDAPGGEEAAHHYTDVCRQCHGASFDRLVQSGRHGGSNDCVGCHMPKRRTDDVVHAVMTDHFIRRNKPQSDLLAQRPEHPADASPYRGEVVPYYPPQPKAGDELYVAIAQVAQESNLSAGILQLKAAIAKYRPASAEYYLQLGDALSNADRFAEAIPWYEAAVNREPESAAALERLARCLSSLRQYSRADSVLKQALDLTPNGAAIWLQRGLIRLQQGKTAEAIAAFEAATNMDPNMPEAFNAAGALWFKTGDLARAEPALRRAILLQPNSAQAHSNLGNVLSAANRFDEARFHFEAAIGFKENYARARLDYAIALAKVHQFEQAKVQAETILDIDPNSAEAHDFLGNLLGAKGELTLAIRHFRDAVRIDPEFAQASLDLGAALADSGDAAAARPYLQKAAQSADPATKSEALKLLEKIGR